MTLLTILALLLSNSVPIFGVLLYGWSASEILFLYWFEAIVIGIYNVLKMSLAQQPALGTFVFLDKQYQPTKLNQIPFFIFHYGLFVGVQGFFVLTLFVKNLVINNSLILAIVSLFLSHGFSMLIHYIVTNEYKRTNLDSLMLAPYKRIFIIHLTLIFSFIVLSPMFLYGIDMAGLIALVTVKIFVDILSHAIEHKKSTNEYVLKPWMHKLK